MINLCYGMKVINITQLPGGSYSHPNGAMDLCGADNGIDFWYAQGIWKCIAGPWGNGTYFFTAVDDAGKNIQVHCADGKDRIVTIALTHSSEIYVDTMVGKIYKNGQAMYEEGRKGFATGNHIHYEVAEGIQTTKHYDKNKGVYTMYNELNPLKVTFVNKSFSTIKYSHGQILPVVNTITYYSPKDEEEEETTGDDEMLYLMPKKVGANIRRALTFENGKNTSEIVGFIPVGKKAKITHFTERFEKDGYEWCQVEYNGIAGYCQLDTKSYLIRRD